MGLYFDAGSLQEDYLQEGFLRLMISRQKGGPWEFVVL
jgi:hypothetical protein